MIVSGRFSFGEVSIAVDDKSFGNRLRRVYGLERADERGDSTPAYTIRIDSANEGAWSCHRLVAPLIGARACSSWEEVAGAIDCFFDAAIRSQVSSDSVTIHASSAVLGGEAVVFVGESGSGKTTLSLELARAADGFLGDEYAFYHPRTGIYFHEKHPVHLKERGALEGVLTLPMLSDCGVESFAFDPASIGLPQLAGSRRLAAVFFPKYSPGARESVIERVALPELPSLLLPSVAGIGDRSDLFKLLARSFACRGVQLFTVRYGDSYDAAARIMEKLG